MSNVDQQFFEDRAIRDAARENLMADVAHVRASLSGAGIASRMFGRVGDGAKDVLEVAKDSAEDNRGIVAALVGAVLLWLSRGPIMDLLGLADDRIGEDDPALNEENENTPQEEEPAAYVTPGEPE
ncbi:hypothetical protein [Erythrobacter sp. MTPC3]|uniref:hypothetical protein n=1 Tax=Erythrobacter sp. MTPC3 TaxID=3056564 RepID=UPI0036F3F26E